MLLLNTAALVAAGKMQASGADMRFYDANCSLLSHWVEEGMNTANTRVFVRVPFIPGNGTATIYLYHGNPTAVDIASPTATFDFWEDFNGNLGQFQTWNNPTYSIAGGILSFAGYGGFVLQSALPYFLNNSSGSNTTGAFLEGRIRYTNFDWPDYSGNLEANSAKYGGCSNNICGEAVIHYMLEKNGSADVATWVGNGAANAYNIHYSPACWTSTNNTWYVLSIKILPNQVFFWRDYGLQCQTGNFSWAKNLQWIILGEFEGNNINCQDTDYDWIRVRKAAAAEPSFSVGAEDCD